MPVPFIFHAISYRNSGKTRRWPSPTTALTLSSSSCTVGAHAEVPHEHADEPDVEQPVGSRTIECLLDLCDAELRARARSRNSKALSEASLPSRDVAKGMQFSVELIIMRKVTNIEKGGILLLPFQDD